MPIPTKIKLDTAQQQLQLNYANEESYALNAEFLRVHSPSAEVQGHGRPILQHGKQFVRLNKIQAAGNYALKLIFDDGHDSGLYTWAYLYQLATQQEQMWQHYLAQLAQAGRFRDPNQSAIRLMDG